VNPISKDISIERVSRGIPKRLASQQTTDAVKHTLRLQEVMQEMKQVFTEGLKLEKLDMNQVRKEIKENREKGPTKYFNEIRLEQLKPPR